MTEKKKHFKISTYQVQESPGYLLGRARLKLAKSIDTALSDRDITGQQGAFLMLLASGTCETAGDVARELYIDSASTTRMIDRLAKRDLLQRVPCPNDRRVIKLVLTDKGNELVQTLPACYVEVLNQHFARFTPEETETLKGLLKKFLQD
jgi:DNA-binding MarR family transcriptional regulator